MTCAKNHYLVHTNLELLFYRVTFFADDVQTALESKESQDPSEIFDARESSFPAALGAIRKWLPSGRLHDAGFRHHAALNGPVVGNNYAQLIQTPAGEKLVNPRRELAERFSGPAFIARFAPGTVGIEYRTFLDGKQVFCHLCERALKRLRKAA